MQTTDFAKLLYQGAFGGGHLIADASAALARLEEEMTSLPEGVPDKPLLEPVGGGLCRLYLGPARRMGLRAETICGLFVETSVSFAKQPSQFECGMRELEALCREGALNANADEAAALYCACRDSGFPPFSHSEFYREAYAPAYRLVSDRLCGFLDLFAAIDDLLERQNSARVAIDGPCASGKSTLAAQLARIYDSQLFHMDDFFLPFERKTPERLAQPGGNVDWERFQADVLDHLHESSFSYSPFDCSIGALGAPVATEKRPVQLIEGVYSLHPALRARYDLRVFLGVNPGLQCQRLHARDPEKIDRFVNEWIPMENHYFGAFGIASQCDIIYQTES